MGHGLFIRTTVALVLGGVLAAVPVTPAGAAIASGSSTAATLPTAPGLPTAGGLAACGRIAADRARLRVAQDIQRRHSAVLPEARRNALLRKDAARIDAAESQLGADSASCAGRWNWPYPNGPRLDQGQRPDCVVYAALQQLNARGGRISQALADQIAAQVTEQAPSATWTTEDIVRATLAARGIPATYRRVPTTVEDTLSEVQQGPITIAVTFTANMDDTDASGHWRVGGAPVGLDHAVVLAGYDPTTGHVLLLNQWGRWWGSDGTMWLTLDEYSRLLTAAVAWDLD